MSFAVGAVVATIHDLLVTLAFLAFFRYELSLNVIAAILTVTGYSTNDTIVKDAVELKYTEAPLTKEQLAELIQIPPR